MCVWPEQVVPAASDFRQDQDSLSNDRFALEYSTHLTLMANDVFNAIHIAILHEERQPCGFAENDIC